MDRRAEVTRRPDLKRWPLASHHAPPRPSARQDYREAGGMATSGLGLLGGPASLTRGCPASHVRMAHLHHPTASDGSGRNARKLPRERGVPRIQKEAGPPICLPWIVDATPTHHPRRNARAAQRRTAQEVAQRDAGDAVRRENVHRDRGGLAPPDPPSLVGGLRPPPSKRAVERTSSGKGKEKVSCVCVCCCCCC